MQLNKIMYIDLVDPLSKISHLRRVRKAIAIDQITAQCVTAAVKGGLKKPGPRERPTFLTFNHDLADCDTKVA